MLQSIHLERDRSMKLDYLLGWAENVVIVAVLPARLGLLAATPWVFLVYAVSAGIVLTLAEDLRYARSVFTRKDIQNYLMVRIAIVAVGGIAPFLLGRALSG